MDEKVRCYFVEKTCTLGYGDPSATFGDKIVETFK